MVIFRHNICPCLTNYSETSYNLLNKPCYVAPSHHGMTDLQVADEGVGLQVWKVAANILSHDQPTRGVQPAWGLGVGLTTPHRKKISLLRNVTKDLGIWLRMGTSGGLFWTRYWTLELHCILGSFSVFAQLAAPQEGLNSIKLVCYTSLHTINFPYFLQYSFPVLRVLSNEASVRTCRFAEIRNSKASSLRACI
jgi:hypothetical protein